MEDSVLAEDVRQARRAMIDEAPGDTLKPVRNRKRGLRVRRRVTLQRSVALGGVGREFYAVGKAVDERIRNVEGHNGDGYIIMRR